MFSTSQKKKVMIFSRVEEILSDQSSLGLPKAQSTTVLGAKPVDGDWIALDFGELTGTATGPRKLDPPRCFSRIRAPLGHSCSPSVLRFRSPGANRRLNQASSSTYSARVLGFSMGGSNRQEPGVNQADGCLQNLALGFNSLIQVPDKIQKSLKVHFGSFLNKDGAGQPVSAQMTSEKVKESCNAAAAAAEVSLGRQLQAWKNNPSWTDELPEIKVTVPNGSLCNLNLRFKAGLPPDAVYNIIIDPENKRVFKNIKEVLSRKVLLDEGSRQIVEVEQAAIWKFLWWSGVLSVHVFVDQDRNNHTVKFKQGRTGFMRKFEGCWKIDPIFVDKEECLPLDPCTLDEYDSCTDGRGRVGSAITLDQLIEPAILPPPPISWYLRGITTKTTEMLVNDLIAETSRLRGIGNNAGGKQDNKQMCNANQTYPAKECVDIKERWRQRRKSGRHGDSHRFVN